MTTPLPCVSSPRATAPTIDSAFAEQIARMQDLLESRHLTEEMRRALFVTACMETWHEGAGACGRGSPSAPSPYLEERENARVPLALDDEDQSQSPDVSAESPLRKRLADRHLRYVEPDHDYPEPQAIPSATPRHYWRRLFGPAGLERIAKEISFKKEATAHYHKFQYGNAPDGLRHGVRILTSNTSAGCGTSRGYWISRRNPFSSVSALKTQ